MKTNSSWKTRLLVLASLLLIMALAAGCGSRSKDEPAEAPADTEVAQPPAEEPSVDADTTATAEAQLTSLEGEEEAEPAEEPVAEEPAAEEPPAEEPSAEQPAEPAVTAGGEIVQGACNHPYYPIRDGAVYRYLMTAPGQEPMEFTTQYRVTGPDSFVTTQSFQDVSTEISWRCTEDGLLSTDFGMGGVDVPGVEYSIDGVTGVTFPPPDKLQVGNTWQSAFTMSGEMSAEGLEMKMNIEAVTDNVLTAFEPVTTPAGTFDAARVDTTTTVETQIDMGDAAGAAAMPAMPGMTMESTLWLAEGVGMVKTVSDDPMGGSSVMELVAIE